MEKQLFHPFFSAFPAGKGAAGSFMGAIRLHTVITAYRDRLRMTALIFLKLAGIHVAQDLCLRVHHIHLHTASMAGSPSVILICDQRAEAIKLFLGNCRAASAKLKRTDRDIRVFLQEPIDVFFQIMLMFFIKYFYFHHLTGIIVTSAGRGCCQTLRETVHRALQRSWR